MRQLLQNRLIVLIGLIFLLVLIGTAVVATGFGSALGTRFSGVPTQENEPVLTQERKVVRKITVSGDDGGCIEVTPDGVIRVFATCDGEATDAARVQDLKNVQELFKQVSETRFTDQYRRPSSNSIKLIIETDQGTEVVYIPAGSAGTSVGSGQVDQIKEIIDRITEEVTAPTSTPVPSTGTPTPTLPPGVSATPTPTLSTDPAPSPSPTPSGSPAPKPFTCGYTETESGPRPYNVSNYICTTEPTPGE